MSEAGPPPVFVPLADAIRFQPEKMAKADLARGAHLFVGLNCFEPGQAQRVHTHAGADKFYLVISGRARFTVGDTTGDAGPGTLIWAPADVPHGVEEAYERTVVLIGMAPGPGGGA